MKSLLLHFIGHLSPTSNALILFELSSCLPNEWGHRLILLDKLGALVWLVKSINQNTRLN